MPIYGLDTRGLLLAIPNGPRPREGGRGHFSRKKVGRIDHCWVTGRGVPSCHRAIRFECRVNTLPPVPLCQHEDSYITSARGVEGPQRAGAASPHKRLINKIHPAPTN